MTARILVVDDSPANVKLLEARLTAEYFVVRTASDGYEALRIAAAGGCDIILLDVMMPGLDGFETCRRLKADLATSHLPVVLVTALDQPADRLKGLEAGADDFLTKPVDDLELLARVRSLTRLKIVVDELRARATSSASVGLQGEMPRLSADDGRGGRILLVDDRQSSAARLQGILAEQHEVVCEPSPQDALFRSAEGRFDLVILNGGLSDYDPLRLCSQLRSLERTRQMPILLLARADDQAQVLRAFDIGINDYLSPPIDRNELLARTRTQLRKKRYADRLYEMLSASIQLAVVDSLTGINNRRYLESHLPGLMEAAADGGRSLSLMILDIDHFKAVNDTYGHDAGDDVLRMFAARVKGVVRAADLLCRLGGEEFIVVMPDTALAVARKIAERVRRSIGDAPFLVGGGSLRIPVTVSIGIADRRLDRMYELLLKRADEALYVAKSTGRDRVSAAAA